MWEQFMTYFLLINFTKYTSYDSIPVHNIF